MKSTLKIAALFSTAILLVALGVALSLWTYRQIEEAAAVRQHTFTVIDGTKDFMSALKDAEAGTQGYLLTGDEVYLEPYLDEINGIGDRLKALRQITLLAAAQKHLDKLVPLTQARLAELSHLIELRRNQGLAPILEINRSGTSTHLMDSIRAEVDSVLRLEDALLALREAEFQASMRQLFTFIVITSLLALLFALAFAYLLYRESQQRYKDLVYLETRHLLETQEETNTKLLQANATLLSHEEALAAKNDELVSAKLAAEKANLAKSEFLASMSHELRTPLNAMLGFAQLMEAAKTPPSSAQQKSIDQILKAGWHLLGLINEILDLAKIESGKTTLSHESMSLAEVLKECQALIEPQAFQREIRVSFPSSDIPFQVLGDRTGVKQVLINLLSNAIKYNRAGGEVIVRCTMSGQNRVRVSVEDTGVGLAPEQLAQLFQPFNRLGRENGPEEGTGIGLVVTKRLVELMGGGVGVESSIGVGSVFWFELVASVAPTPGSRSIGEIDADDQDYAAANDVSSLRTLLYVEDNPANLALVEELISMHSNLKLLTAIDGFVGIQLARDNQPDVILMDIHLPGMSGLDALKVLREDPATAHIPVLALSANAMPRDIEKAMQAGFFRYLTKPIKVDEFMEAIHFALRAEEGSVRLH